jgi:hypothetical protein
MAGRRAAVGNRLLVRDGGAACAGEMSVTRLYQEVFNPSIPFSH